MPNYADPKVEQVQQESSQIAIQPVDLDSVEKDLLEIARQAGAMIKENLSSRNKKIECKQSISDMVTETDKAVEDLVKSFIHSRYPSHRILAEESASGQDKLGGDPTWIIDPIDGTMNFAKTNPFNCVSIGFSVNEEVLLGVVYQPMYDEMFSARKGRGAFLNGQKIRVSGCEDLQHAMVNTGFSAAPLQLLKNPDLPESLKERLLTLRSLTHHNFEALLSNCVDIRRGGASALECCWVACGRLDASFELGNKEWDLSAGILIIEEAGGICSDLNGTRPLDIGNRNYLVASSEKVLKELAGILKPCPFDFRQLEADMHFFKNSKN